MQFASQTLLPAGNVLPRIITPVCTDGEKKRESKKRIERPNSPRLWPRSVAHWRNVAQAFGEDDIS